MILKSWSGMRKYLEQDMLADSLKGRVRYNCTTYKGMDDCKIFEIFIDGECVKQFSHETLNSYFLCNKLSVKGEHQSPMVAKDYWEGYWETQEQIPVENCTEYNDWTFCDALADYREQPIDKSLTSSDAIVRMFAILDRRVGKRTLEKLPPIDQIQPVWLQSFHRLRLEAEGMISNQI
jgi:hypothetical protein